MHVEVRPMQVRDIPAIQELQSICFPGMPPWSEEVFRTQMSRFPEGQIVALADGRVVATSSSLMVKAEAWSRPHTFNEVCDHGLISHHDPGGDALYGIDIAVDPRLRGLRLAHRIYEARKEVMRHFNLRSFLIAGRIPGLAAHAALLDAAAYVRKVVDKDLVDPVLTTQLANGFTIRAILPGYLPSDAESCGNAVFMEWLNPDHVPSGTVVVGRVRVAAAQVMMRPFDDWQAFARQSDWFVDAAADHHADFIVFPELFIEQLEPTMKAERPGLVAREMAGLAPRYVELFTGLAVRHAVNIVAGSIFVLEDGVLRNVAHLFRRDGTVARQPKLHIPPAESRWLGVRGGNALEVIPTDRGTVAILTGYDVEFPELARMAAHGGADICFTPYAADLMQSHLRLRICAHANAISNGQYAVLCGSCGSMPQVAGSDARYAQSCVLTPCDLFFPADGIAGEVPPGIETLLVQELDLHLLRHYRMYGSVRHQMARRNDLYRLHWRQHPEERRRRPGNGTTRRRQKPPAS